MGCLPLGNFYVTGYGRRLQINAMPPEYTPQEQFALSNTFNPMYWIGNLQALFCGNLAQMNGSQYAGAYQAGQQLGQQVSENIAINTSFNMLNGNITSLKTDLEQALNSDKLTDEQKATIKQQKQRAEELQQKLEDIRLLQQQGATPEQVKAVLSQLSNEYRDLRDEVQAFADKIKQELEAGNNAGNTGNTDNAGGSSNTGNAGEVGNTDGATETVGTSGTDRRKWADSLYQSGTDSFLGWGTDDDSFEALIGQLNGSNVIELIDTFENRYGDFAIFVGSEAEHYQKKLVFRQILSALEDRAETAGVSNEISEYVKQVNSELNKWVISKTNLNASIKNIVTVIKNKEKETANNNNK